MALFPRPWLVQQGATLSETVRRAEGQAKGAPDVVRSRPQVARSVRPCAMPAVEVLQELRSKRHLHQAQTLCTAIKHVQPGAAALMQHAIS